MLAGLPVWNLYNYLLATSGGGNKCTGVKVVNICNIAFVSGCLVSKKVLVSRKILVVGTMRAGQLRLIKWWLN